jgi:anti-sigma factor RsiW
MNADECAQTRNELGVYLLGAIEPHERARLENHVGSCPSCREKLAALAGMPALLRKVPADEAIRAWMDDGSDQPPTPPLEMLLSKVSRTRRRRRRWVIAAAALGAGLAAVGVPVFRSGAVTPPPTAAAPRWAATATATGANPVTGVSAAIRYANQPWGSELEVRVTGIPVGTRCQLWVTDARGQDVAAGGWTIAAGRQPGWYLASVPFQAGALRHFEVTADGKAEVTVRVR